MMDNAFRFHTVEPGSRTTCAPSDVEPSCLYTFSRKISLPTLPTLCVCCSLRYKSFALPTFRPTHELLLTCIAIVAFNLYHSLPCDCAMGDFAPRRTRMLPHTVSALPNGLFVVLCIVLGEDPPPPPEVVRKASSRQPASIFSAKVKVMWERGLSPPLV